MKGLMTGQVLVAVLLAAITAASSVDPIWLSPSSVGSYSEQFPDLGVWSNISVGAGSRNSKPVVVMDSKKTIWILLGSTYSVSRFNVWNYDPKTDLYRWVAGSGNSTTDPRKPGALRVPSPSNHPGSVTNTPSTIDHNDNIWFMTSTSSPGELWMFNTTSYYFTRMKGDNLDPKYPVYGTLGQPGDDVSPGHTIGGCLVVDSSNNLWQIHGVTLGVSIANRVWHFNTTSYQWTFFGGNNDSFIDTVFGDNPFYGGRSQQACDIDANDRIWLFGGAGLIAYYYNDVWSYDTHSLQWRLEFGSDSSYGASATVAMANDFATGNHPAGNGYSTFVDRKDGTLLLLGGFVTSTNDIWLFNKTLKQWKLIYGSLSQQKNPGNFSNYRTPGSVLPGGRSFHGSASGLNIDGDVFIYGGGSGSIFNDIWLIPQDQCTVSSLNKCSLNARCIEAMIGYSCECNDGFVGDGFTCQAVVPPMSPPVSAPLSPPLSTPSSPSDEPSQSPLPPSTPPSNSPLSIPSSPSDVPSQSPSSGPSQSPSSSPLSTEPSQAPTTPVSSPTPRRNTLVSRGVTVESSLFTVLSLIVIAVVSFC